ncbi:urease accessory protein UreE [Mesorhizobium sp. J428]|uniref:urease accessory protein UreE n=1 Tax=Mesorhizobium sp. J428 TaxID=2898440 RepID=UPI002150DE7E|nr:urease accessory protein UreE [Mesorhizobium sp. J428]MCR5857733.1 urease accessory protein UreE [Mesorhizobium sp. J428]
MKLSMNTDFTKMPRAGSVIRAADLSEGARIIPFDLAVLDHEGRHLRRRVVELVHGDKVLVDLPDAVQLENHDVLVLDDGRHAEIIAAEEEVYDIRAKGPVHLAELAWHIGNRHLAAQIEEDRILILRDHVIKAMLEGLGATVTDASEPFHPVRGAYSGHSHGHGPQPDAYGRMPRDPHYGHNHGPDQHHHGHGHHDHDHGHHHGEADRFGRLPGDPHYGHNHG